MTSSAAPALPPPSFDTPEALLKGWMRLINEGRVDEVLALYDESAVLIPTFSNRLLATPAGIRDYFERLGAREELSIALHEKTVNTQALGQGIGRDLHAVSGIYCWRFAIDGELFNFEARFSYVLDLGRPRPILHHHSSQIPRVI